MKYYILCWALAITAGCNKNNADDYYWGEAFAKLNGTAWEARTRIDVNKSDGTTININFNRLNKHGLVLDNLYIFKVPLETGKFKLSLTDVGEDDSLSGSSFYTLIDGDILNDSYELADGEQENYIEVTKIEGDKIWMEFQMVLAIKRYGQIPKYPDTIRITEGYAKGKVE